jgi:5-methylcytosine-specific restriction endonuclease McrA
LSSRFKRKLSALQPPVATLAPLIGYSSGNEQARSRYRDATIASRSWYKTSKWQALRWQVLVRDLFTCRKCGRIITEKGKAIADHIVAHKGRTDLFWSIDNLQCLCAECHDSAKQAEEKAAGR